MQISDLESRMQLLVGKPVLAKNLAGNSLNLWFIATPDQPQTQRLWVDPPWRVETKAGIESSSYGFPTDNDGLETEAEYRFRFEKACSNSDCLIGATLTAIEIDRLTSDLKLAFDNGRILRNFAVDLQSENWHFHDYALARRYGVHVICIETEPHDA